MSQYMHMRGLTRAVSYGIYAEFQEIISKESSDKTNRTLDEFIVSKLNEPSFVVDPTSPSELRWGPKEYLEFREKALSAFARAKITLEELRAKGDRKTTRTRVIDIELYKLFANEFPISPFEAGVESNWEYLALVVLPDLVLERHPVKQSLHDSIDFEDFEDGDLEDDRSSVLPKRFKGGERNAFRRIWIRAHAARRDLSLLEEALEDNLVAVFERTRVSQNPTIAMSVLNAMQRLRDLESDPNATFEDIVRDAMKRVVRLMSVKNLDVLPEELLNDETYKLFLEAKSSIGLTR
jgi:hypothetical protein